MNRDLHLTWERVGISKNTLSVGVLRSSINPGLSDKSLFSPKNKQSSSIHGVSSVMQWRGELAFPKRKQMSLSGSCKAQIIWHLNFATKVRQCPSLKLMFWVYWNPCHHVFHAESWPPTSLVWNILVSLLRGCHNQKNIIFWLFSKKSLKWQIDIFLVRGDECLDSQQWSFFPFL